MSQIWKLGAVVNAQADFEPALRDQEMPREFVRLLQRGLCQQAACGMATMPTLQELREVLHREIENLGQT